MKNDITLSTRPPRNPERSPTITPTTLAKIVAVVAIVSETRHP